jgi:hypothetical protein
VKLLEMLEQSIERLVEGTTGSLFNQPLQPAEIGKKLERAMVSEQRASVGTAIVPNVYTVGLHPKDFAQVSGYSGGLARQLEAWLAKVATERNFSVVDRIQVSITEDPAARRRNPLVAAVIADRRQGPTPDRVQPAQATSVYRIEPTNQGLTASLRGLDGAFVGRTYPVPPGATTVGRAPDNDIVIDSPDVSRRHARIESGAGGIRVHDLNSTNGTRINGDPIRISDIDPRDEIAFGGQRFAIEIYAPEHGRGRTR